MRIIAPVCIVLAASPTTSAQTFDQLTTSATPYTIAANSVAVLSVDATQDAPEAPACGATCPKEGYMVCSGACPAECYCADGWGVYVSAEALGDAAHLAIAMSDQAPDADTRNADTAYERFSATAEWSVMPFITLFTHTEDVANSRKRSSSREVYGLVDLCAATAVAGGATAVGDNVLECNCDDCSDSCGVVGSRKSQRCSTDEDQVADFSGCTYYASSDALSGPARDASFCCNAVPAPFEDYVGAISQHQHFHDWKPPPKTHFASWSATTCNATTGMSTGELAFEQLAISRCQKEILATGTYYLYVVNTGDMPQDIKLSFSLSTVSTDEASVCYGNRFDGTVVGQGGAGRPTYLVALGSALTAMWLVS
jgi:hypothetical protein